MKASACRVSRHWQCPIIGQWNEKDTKMEIRRGGSQPSNKGSEEYFTGAVRIDPLFQAPNPARVVGANVTFEPGARTAWHTHPLGQTLIVTARLRLGSAARRTGRGNSSRRRYLVSTWGEALAWSRSDDGDDAFRNSGSVERENCRVDGKGHRRKLSALTRGVGQQLQIQPIARLRTGSRSGRRCGPGLR